MLSKKWTDIINESDIRGIALEGVEGEAVNLGDEVVWKAAAAFARWLADMTNKKTDELKIGIGHDSRLSADRMKAAAIKGLASMGCSIFDCGLASTPAMFMTTVTEGYRYDGSIMITASHLPYNRNGLKFFMSRGGLEKKDIKEILGIADTLADDVTANAARVTKVDFISVYAAELVRKIREGIQHPTHPDKPLQDFKIVVDAGNGAGGFFVDQVLVPLGADVTGSQYLEPNGAFPNHIPNPEDKEAMGAITRAVLEQKADLGIIFDTDVDRAGAVDRNGKEINRNRLVALMSAIVLEEHPHTTIVTDSITSSGLKIFIEDRLGGIHHRFKRGYKNVINEAIRLNQEDRECHLAIETSGHGALKENYFLDDGAYLMTKILIKMARLHMEDKKDIGELIADLAEPAEAMEFRMRISGEDFKETANRVLKELDEYASTQPGWTKAADNHEGVRVSFDKEHGDGWMLLRMSLHDPIMPLNIESDSESGISKIAPQILEFLNRYLNLNLDPLKDFVKKNRKETL